MSCGCSGLCPGVGGCAPVAPPPSWVSEMLTRVPGLYPVLLFARRRPVLVVGILMVGVVAWVLAKKR